MSTQVTIRINGVDRDSLINIHANQFSDGILDGNIDQRLPDDAEARSICAMIVNGHGSQNADELVMDLAAATSATEEPVMKSTINDLKPKHFSVAQLTKLEEAFIKQTSPDRYRLYVLAMESNVTFLDVQAWFKLRRLKWIQEIGKRTPDSITAIDC